jgi:uncharacterized protein
MAHAEVKGSGIHGKGVYASCCIIAGTQLYEYTGEKILKSEGDRRAEINLKRGLTYLVELDDEHDIDGEVGGNDSRFINHSCDPNCSFEFTGDRILVHALRDISPGEELTLDYEFDESGMNVPCRCGSANCRGYIIASELIYLVRKKSIISGSKNPLSFPAQLS